MGVKFDLDFEHWPNRDIFDFETATGLVFFDELAKAAAASNGSVAVTLLSAKFILGVAWISNRRDEPTLTFDDAVERWPYMKLIESITETWADPLGASANRATRRASKRKPPSSRRSSPASPSATSSA